MDDLVELPSNNMYVLKNLWKVCKSDDFNCNVKNKRKKFRISCWVEPAEVKFSTADLLQIQLCLSQTELNGESVILALSANARVLNMPSIGLIMRYFLLYFLYREVSRFPTVHFYLRQCAQSSA